MLAARCRSKIGGQTDALTRMEGLLQKYFENHLERHERGLSNLLAILLSGPSGVGKLHLAKTFAEESSLKYEVVRIEKFFQASLDRIFSTIFTAFTESDASIFILDNVEMLTGKLNETSTDYDRNIQAAFSCVFETLSSGSFVKIIIGITSLPEHMELHWFCGALFAHHIRVRVSKLEQRKEILSIILKDILSNEDIGKLARKLHGHTVADMIQLKGRVIQSFIESGRPFNPSLEDFLVAQQFIRPSLMAGYHRPAPSERFEDLVGLEDAIDVIQQQILAPIADPELSRLYQIGLPRGILIHGKTGTGKTHLAMALVREAGLNYISVAGPSIRSKYVGETEKRLAAVFETARNCAPSLLIIDQMETLISRRDEQSQTSDNSSNRLITCFLTEIDGLKSKDSEDQVIVIGITDDIGKLDPAMLRPGRLGIHIKTPDVLDEQSRRTYLSKVCKVNMSLKDEELERIVKSTEGLNGAQLDALVREAAMRALDDGVVLFKHFLDKSM